MPAIPEAEAAERLAKAVETVSEYDYLVEFYRQLYSEPLAPDVSGDKVEHLRKFLVDRIRGGLEPELIAELWRVVFLDHRKVYYNEEEKTINYREGRFANVD